MDHSAESFLRPRQLFQLMAQHRRHWLVPFAVVALLTAAYALFRSDCWEASQALIIRGEAKVEQNRAGQLTDVNEMKTIQETILELCRSKSVLHAALVAVGSPANASHPELWPTERDVASLRKELTLVPPKGAEFGKTEIFYLKVKDTNRPRAVALADAVTRQVEQRFRKLRDTKYESMVAELQQAEHVAEVDLATATRQLTKLETGVGVDLAELRLMQASSGANSNLRQKLVELQSESRAIESDKRRDQQLLELLIASREDPGQLMAAPDSLLTSQPGLRRLKEGLVDAQLTAARLAGAMAKDHPLLLAARTSEVEIGDELHAELGIAIRGIQVNLETADRRLASLKQQIDETSSRLERLAGLRADYANLVAMAENRTALLESNRAKLAEARANLASATGTSLISRIDAPDTGIYPVGPGRLLIVLAGVAGGLVVGVGVLLLLHAPAPTLPQFGPSQGVAGQPAWAGVLTGTYGVAVPSEGLALSGGLCQLSGRGHH